MTLKEFKNNYRKFGREHLKNAKTGKFLSDFDKRDYDNWIVKGIDVGMELDNIDKAVHAYLLIEIEEAKNERLCV